MLEIQPASLSQPSERVPEIISSNINVGERNQKMEHLKSIIKNTMVFLTCFHLVLLSIDVVLGWMVPWTVPLLALITVSYVDLFYVWMQSIKVLQKILEISNVLCSITTLISLCLADTTNPKTFSFLIGVNLLIQTSLVIEKLFSYLYWEENSILNFFYQLTKLLILIQVSILGLKRFQLISMDDKNLLICCWVLISLLALQFVVTFGMLINVFFYEPLGQSRTFKLRLLCWIFSAYASLFVSGLTLIINTQHFLKYNKTIFNVSLHVSTTIVFMALNLFGTCTFINKLTNELDLSGSSMALSRSGASQLAVNNFNLDRNDDGAAGQSPSLILDRKKKKRKSFKLLDQTTRFQQITGTFFRAEEDIQKDAEEQYLTRERSTSTASQLCQICFQNPSDIIIQPCNHGGLCRKCGKSIFTGQRQCYLCRGVFFQLNIQSKQPEYQKQSRMETFGLPQNTWIELT